MRVNRAGCEGFTLVEILVAIAIIALLAGMLLPILGSLTSAARLTKCTGNLAQVYAGFRSYGAYRDGFLPPVGRPDEGPVWRMEIGPLLGSTDALGKDKVFGCPAHPGRTPSYGLSHHWAAGEDLGDDPDGLLGALTPELDDARSPARTVFVCGAGYVGNPEERPREWREADDPDITGTVTVRFPHDNHLGEADGKYTLWVTDPWRPVPRHRPASTNCLFLDGHVAALETRDLVDDLFGEPRCLYDNQ